MDVNSEEAILFEHIGLLDGLVRDKNSSLHDRIHDLYMRDAYENGLRLSMDTLLHDYLTFLYTHFRMRKQFSSTEKQKSYIEQMMKLLAQYPDAGEYVREWLSILPLPDVPK